MELHDFESSSSAAGNGQSRPMKDMVKDLIGQAQRLMREELHLAKIEIRDEAKKAGEGAAFAGAGGVVLHAGFLVLCAFLVLALGQAVAMWLSALIVGVVLVAAGALVSKTGVDRLKKVRKPEQTIETLKEDKQWARETIRDVKSRTHANA